jgi:hypothetical protein
VNRGAPHAVGLRESAHASDTALLIACLHSRSFGLTHDVHSYRSTIYYADTLLCKRRQHPSLVSEVLHH